MLRSFRKLQTKLVILFVLVLLIPTAIIAAYTLSTQTESVLNRARQESLDDNKLLAARLEERFQRVIPDLKFLSTLPAVQSYIRTVTTGDVVGQNVAIADINRALLNFIQTVPDYDQLRLLDVKGFEVARVNQTRPNDPTIQPYVVPQAELQDKSGRDYFIETIKLPAGAVHISAYNLNQEQGQIEVPYKPVQRFATPIYNVRNELVGVMIVNMLGSYITAPLSQAEQSTQRFLIDPNGTYLAAPDPALLYGPDLKTGASFLTDRPTDAAAILANQQSQSTVGGDFIETFVTIAPASLPTIRWLLYEKQPVDAALAEITGLRVGTLFLAGLALIGAVIVATFVTRSIVRPVRDLATATQEVAAGNLKVAVPTPRTKDEIGQLTQAFGQMTARLSENVTALQTRAKELEVANALAREASRVKSEFLATMSHELRTPLNAMIGFTELMLSGVSGPLTDKQSHQLKRIHTNSLRLLSLIDDVLDLSRIEAGRVDIVNKPMNIHAFAEQITAQTAGLVIDKPFKFTTSVDPNMPLALLGDKDRLEEVVLNLVSNAFKFTQQGEVSLRFFRLDAAQWAISVQDTGIGIPAHAQEYIFEEFRQVDGSSRRAYGGSGLGLAICRNLCRLMGGDISVKSNLGTGSTFTVRLPLHAAASTEPALEAVQA